MAEVFEAIGNLRFLEVVGLNVAGCDTRRGLKSHVCTIKFQSANKHLYPC